MGYYEIEWDDYHQCWTAYSTSTGLICSDKGREECIAKVEAMGYIWAGA